MTTNYNLITSQLDEVKEQYVEIVVDRMSTEDLVEFVTETLSNRFDRMPENEFKDNIYEVEDEYLYDELVDNVNIENDTEYLSVTMQANNDIYAFKVHPNISSMYKKDALIILEETDITLLVHLKS